MRLDDTIAAISTPPGEGGIGIVRISGAKARDLVSGLFVSPSGRHLARWTSHRMTYGFIVDADGVRVDEVLAVFMQAPRSYTAEDVVEIHAHGGPAVLHRILQLCLSVGARLAEPGEFTRRAFLNGRLDLAQAEAVMDVIRARTEGSRRRAFSQFSGTLSGRVMALREDILTWLAQLEAQIDFPDDDIPPTPPPVLEARAQQLRAQVQVLLDTAEEGRIYRDGIRVAIVGRPNVGKSSLLNLLLGDERAIVTDMAGTTRDSLEEWANLGGLPICLVDTAGIREATDRVETIGIQRSRQAIENSDVVLVLIDASRPWSSDDDTLATLVAGRKGLVVLNKMDLPTALTVAEVTTHVALDVVPMSVLQASGLDHLKDALLTLVRVHGAGGAGDCVVASSRHRESLWRARDSLVRILATIEAGLPVDFLTIDLRAALDAMGEVTGQSITEDVLDKIFSEFCLGK